MSAWSPHRRRLAVAAGAAALATGIVAGSLGATPGAVRAAAAWVAVAVGALFAPAAVAVVVVGGQAMAASLHLGGALASPLLLVPIVAGVVLSAELLAAVAWRDTPLEREPAGEIRASARPAALSAAVFVAVALAGALPGPEGLVAVLVAAAATAGLGILVAGRLR